MIFVNKPAECWLTYGTGDTKGMLTAPLCAPLPMLPQKCCCHGTKTPQWDNLTDKLLGLPLEKTLCCARAPGKVAVLLTLSHRVLWLLKFPWLKASLENLSRCLGSVLLSKVPVLPLSNPADGAVSTGWYFLNVQQKWMAERYYLCGCCSSLSQEGLC